MMTGLLADVLTSPALDRVARAEARLGRLSARMRATADGRRGTMILFIWAFVEAMAWPLIPDSALAGMAFASPGRYVRNLIVTVAGTVSGGVTGLLLGRLGLSWHLPLVTERMQGAAAGWLGSEGVAGLWHQPLSGVPYKAFVQAAAHTDVGYLDWMAMTVAARGTRIAIVGGVAALAGLALRRWVPVSAQPIVHIGTVIVVTLGLFGGLALVVMSWSG